MRSAAVLVALLLLAGCAETSAPAPSGDTPAWSFTDTEGARHSNATTTGAPVMLFFMASWCPTCKSKAPMLAEVHADLAPRGLQTFSVSFDPEDGPEELRAWKERYAQPWPHGVDPGLSMQRTFGITSQSSVVVLDGEGRVAGTWGYPGPVEGDLRAALDAAFATT